MCIVVCIASIYVISQWDTRPFVDSLRGSSVKIGTIQRRLAWPLRKDDTHKTRSVNIVLFETRVPSSSRRQLVIRRQKRFLRFRTDARQARLAKRRSIREVFTFLLLLLLLIIIITMCFMISSSIIMMMMSIIIRSPRPVEVRQAVSSRLGFARVAGCRSQTLYVYIYIYIYTYTHSYMIYVYTYVYMYLSLHISCMCLYILDSGPRWRGWYYSFRVRPAGTSLWSRLSPWVARAVHIQVCILYNLCVYIYIYA